MPLLELLLQNGARAAWADAAGRQALHYAVLAARTEAAKLLVPPPPPSQSRRPRSPARTAQLPACALAASRCRPASAQPGVSIA